MLQCEERSLLDYCLETLDDTVCATTILTCATRDATATGAGKGREIPSKITDHVAHIASIYVTLLVFVLGWIRVHFVD